MNWGFLFDLGEMAVAALLGYRAGVAPGARCLERARRVRAETRELLDRMRRTEITAEARLQESRELLALASGEASGSELMPVRAAMELCNLAGHEAVLLNTREDGLHLVATRVGMCLVPPPEWDLYRVLCGAERGVV